MTEGILPAHWETISSEDSYVGKEHFFGFQAINSTEFSKNVAGVAFNGCVGGRDPILATEPNRWGGRRIVGFAQFQPRGNLIVAKREEVGLEPYPNTATYPSLSTVCQEYAIQAGSLVELQEALKDDVFRADVFLRALTNRLIAHFGETK